MVWHGFGPKLANFAICFVLAIYGRKMCFIIFYIDHGNAFYDILERKNIFLGYKNKKFKKSKNWHFSMVLVQNWPFFQLLFFAKKLWKCVLWYSRTKKNNFLCDKNKKKKSRKIDIFAKGLVNGFVPKLAIFPTFFLFNIGHGKVFYDILEQKKTTF